MSTRLQTGVIGLSLGMAMGMPAAFAETFSGKINGHSCAHAGTTCPIDRFDPHIALEADFVLQKSDGDYMFMPNLPRSVKARHALSDVDVSGDLNPRYQSIDVNELRVDGKIVWSKAMQQAEFENTYSSSPIPGR